MAKKSNQVHIALELFAGAGGLALATKNAGMKAIGLVERDSLACSTLRENIKTLGIKNRDQILNIALDFGSARHLDFSYDILIGGPPCQPFSMGGLRHGHRDDRDMFPVFTEFVHHARPKGFVIENVAGLRSGRCLRYFTKIISSLAKKSKVSLPARLDFDLGIPILAGKSDYRVHFKVLNAADFGVAQNRIRMFIVGLRNDLNCTWEWPAPTHSWEALMNCQYITKDYFLRYDLPAPKITIREREALLRKVSSTPSLLLKPHLTVRDAIGDLPDPRGEYASEYCNHIYIPGARSYPGHSGSNWDEPAKTIKAGVHGCPGGENMVKMSRGQVRYFTVRELARLQGFPDKFKFVGTRNQCVRQLGNAVPIPLGEAIVKQLSRVLSYNGHGKMRGAAAESISETV